MAKKLTQQEKTTLERIKAGEPIDSRIESITEARINPLAKVRAHRPSKVDVINMHTKADGSLRMGAGGIPYLTVKPKNCRCYNCGKKFEKGDEILCFVWSEPYEYYCTEECLQDTVDAETLQVVVE